ncbi:MAG: metallophosphoesterase, partial [Acidobacteriaceae bacterium]
MKTLIIPDIHNKIEIADWIVGAEPADVVVYLGDYFDDFGDGPEDARRVAEWLNRTALRDDRVCLIGNHDVPYLFPATLKHTMCSGWSVAKAQAIKVTIDPGAVARMKLVYADGVPDSSIFSHAGMS